MDTNISINGYVIPESKTFAHSTRMADSWRAAPERVIQPEMNVGSAEINIKVFDGSTSQLGIARKTRNPLKLLHRRQTLDMTDCFIYDTRYEVDSNVGHYIADTIPKILAAKTSISAATGNEVDVYAILKEGSSRMSVEVFENLGIPVVSTEANVKGHIIKTSVVRPTTSIDGTICHANGPTMIGSLPDIYASFRDKLLNKRTDRQEKVFLSRKSSRTIENEDEITELLDGHGFKKYYFETGELSVIEQWELISGAKQIIAIHGAGLSPLIYNLNGLLLPQGNLSGLRIIELYGAGYFVDFNRRLAAVMNAHWCGVRGRISPEIVRDLDDRGGGRVHQFSSFRVDPQTLKLALDYSETVRSSEAFN